MNYSRCCVLVAGTVFVGLSCASFAHANEPMDDADALAGPSVSSPAAAETLSIVRKDFQGKVERLEERPEVAAVRLLALDEATRSKVDAIISDRAATASRVIFEHYDEFLSFQNVVQAGEPNSAEQRRERMQVVQTLRRIARPMFEPAFVETLADALSKEQAAQLRDMVREYRDAIVASDSAARRGGSDEQTSADTMQDDSMQDDEAAKKSQKSATKRGDRRAQGAARIEEQVFEVRQVGRELGRSFKAFVDERRDRTEQIYGLVEATPEQRERIDKIVRSRGEAAALRPTDEHRREMFAAILKELTPQQRKKLIAETRGK